MRNWTKIKQRYGLTKKEYLEILEHQGGECWICGSDKKLVVDHCHESKEVRGIICNSCNLMIGHAREDTSNLEKAIYYLWQKKEKY